VRRHADETVPLQVTDAEGPASALLDRVAQPCFRHASFPGYFVRPNIDLDYINSSCVAIAIRPGRFSTRIALRSGWMIPRDAQSHRSRLTVNRVVPAI
jgi:hypothetical protein